MPIDLGLTAGDSSRPAQRFIVLQALTAALARTRTYPEIAAVIIDEALPALKAEVGVVALVSEDERWLRNVGFKGVDAATEDAWRDYSVDSPVPVAEAARTRQSILVRSIEERNARYPVLAQIHGLQHGGPVTAFPLIVDARLLGVLAFCWGGPLELDAGDLAFLQTLAEQCGLAIERARLYELAAREIAERKASEAKLREANERKDEFLAMLGHELRNPLASIRGATDVCGELVRRLGQQEPRIERVHEVLERQTAHMKRLIDDLLDVSRLVRGQLALQLSPLDLVQLLRECTGDHAAAFLAAGIALQVELPAEPVWIQADATRLAQAVANLLHNALKFSERGTTVRVALELEHGRALVEVRDQGAGIDAALLPRLFEPFAQADRTLARSSGGLGIGLHVVQGLLRLHGGEVTAQSSGAGKGSTFRLALPLAPPPARRPSSGAPVASRGKLRILVVEDNEDAAEMLGLLLSSSGHEVRLAHRAADAIRLLDEWRAEVILSDIGLPDMDGFDLARAIRLRERERGLQRPLLIAITGYGNEAYRVKAREAGFDLHLTKPVDVRTLEQMLSGAGVS